MFPKFSRSSFVLSTSVALLVVACGGDGNQAVLDDKGRADAAIVAVKTFVQKNLDDLEKASAAIADAAPPPDADGWNATADKAAVDKMKDEWKKARRAYESIEGAIAVVFPDLDEATDARYDDFISAGPDDNLFDDQGVIGVHAIERILWADQIPANVVAFESALTGYKAAAFPQNQAEATDFKGKLCARLTADTHSMADQFKKLALDVPSAYRGVIGSAEEQVEKIDKAATGEEESRYAQFTLGDMRANVAAAKETYKIFRDWLLTKENGASTDAKINAAFGKLDEGYAKISGDNLPGLPEGWSSDHPTEMQLATPFGTLFTLIRFQSDPEQEGSLVFEMNASADLLGINPLPVP
jgi:iron uptake system component EfeO